MRVTNLKHENSASNNIVLNSDGSVGGDLATTLASKQADVMTTKGDLAAYGTAVARLGVGTNGQVLTADSGETLGVKWAAGGLTLITSNSFTGVSSVSINNCFSATYDNYLIIFSCYGSTTAANILARLGASASFDSGSNYSYAYENPQRGGTTSVVAGNATTSWQLADNVATTTTSDLSTTLVISNPFLARSTNYSLNSWSRQVMKALPGGGTHDLTSSYTDIQLLASTGTITGVVRVYGYKG